jgi:hypothetical protein
MSATGNETVESVLPPASMSIGRTYPGDGAGVITFDIEWTGGRLKLEMSLADFALAVTGRGATPAKVCKWKGAQ